MNYLQYIFSDKKAHKFWAFFYVIIVIPYLIGFVITLKRGQLSEVDPINYFYFIFFVTAFFLFYSVGYFHLKRQEKFLSKYSKLIDNTSELDKEVVVYRESYMLKGIRTNFEARIIPKPKRDTFKVCKMDNLIILIGNTYDWGFLRRDFSPIVVNINDYENLKKFSYAKNPRISSVNWIENDLEIVFERSVFGIRKIRLNNWKENN